MEQKEFKYRLDESTKKLIEFTQSMVTNLISENVEFLIEPNSRETSEHLNEKELYKLVELNKLEGKLFDSKEVNSLLYDSGREYSLNCVKLFPSTSSDRFDRKRIG